MKRERLLVLSSLLCLVLLLLLACTPTTTSTSTPTVKPTPTPQATSASEPFYRGKTLTLLLPFPPGGGADIFVRIIASRLPKFIPGNPGVIVRNMPGGGGVTGANYVYNLAKPDGLTLLTHAAGLNLPALVQLKGVRYNLADMPIVMAGTGEGAFVYCKSGLISKFDDIYDKPLLIFGNAQVTLSSAAVFVLGKEILGFKTDRVVLGYDNSADALRGFLAGEVNSSGSVTASYLTNVKPLEDKGEVVMLFQSGILNPEGKIQRAVVTPQLPTLYDRYVEKYSKEPSGKVWQAYKAWLGSVVLEKGLFFPPRTPDAIVSVLAEACRKMGNDPEFVAVAKNLSGIEVVTGEPMRKLFNEVFVNLDKEAISWFKNWLAGFGTE